MTIIDRIKELARMDRISLAELERRAGLSSGSITKWNKSFPSIDKLDKIASYFNVSTDYLAGRTDRKDPWPASTPEEDFGSPMMEETKATYSHADLKKMIDNAQTYEGTPLEDSDKEALMAYLEGRLSDRK